MRGEGGVTGEGKLVGESFIHGIGAPWQLQIYTHLVHEYFIHILCFYAEMLW